MTTKKKKKPIAEINLKVMERLIGPSIDIQPEDQLCMDKLVKRFTKTFSAFITYYDFKQYESCLGALAEVEEIMYAIVEKFCLEKQVIPEIRKALHREKRMIKKNLLLKQVMEECKMDVEKIELIQEAETFKDINKWLDARELYALELLAVFFSYIESNISLESKQCTVELIGEGYRKDFAFHDNYTNNKWNPHLCYRIEFSEDKRKELGIFDRDEIYYYIIIKEYLLCGFAIATDPKDCYKDGKYIEGSEVEVLKRYRDTKLYKNIEIFITSNIIPFDWLCYEYIYAENKKPINFKTWDDNYLQLIYSKKDTQSVPDNLKINDKTYLNKKMVDNILKNCESYFKDILKSMLA